MINSKSRVSNSDFLYLHHGQNLHRAFLCAVGLRGFPPGTTFTSVNIVWLYVIKYSFFSDMIIFIIAYLTAESSTGNKKRS